MAAFAAAPAAAAEEVTASAGYGQQWRGVTLFATYVEDDFGRAIPVQIDFQWAGVRSYWERKVLVTFDGSAGLTTGYGGNSNPKFFLLGGNAGARVEMGQRFTPAKDTSFYLGGTAVLKGSAVAVTTAPIGNYDSINSVDGLGGLNGVAALRVNPGLSLLRGDVSLLITAFIEESLRDPGAARTGPLFTSFGARAQLDVVRTWTATLEGLWGTTWGRTDAYTGTVDVGSRFEVTAMLRRRLGPVWLALDANLHGTQNVATTTAKNVYATSTPTWVSVGLTFGVSL